MVIKNNTNNEPIDNQKEPDNSLDTKPKRIRRQATEEELNHPLHRVKLKPLLERLVEHYGWEYLGERTNIRCFMYNPTMKSSIGFLRKTTWAREFVEDIYIEMVENKSS
ncbi:VF530 family DNA-binding protein [Aurantibacter sp.]|uniref:VF530 family protein n=1 Tax=Aurantibacter sp. TaxID=2807103 RepID=UPI0035C7A606